MDDKVLTGFAEDLAERAAVSGFAATKFLTPGEAEVVRRWFANRKDVTVVFDGGYASAERVMAVFLNPDWGEYERDGIMAAVRLSHRAQDSIGHRDVLGALMNLGIVRETVGDIVCVENDAPTTLVCTKEIAGFIVENLVKVGRVGVKTEKIALEDLPEREENIEVKSITVSSMRLDAVVGGVFNVSRGTAADAIAAGKVTVNHSECLKSDKELAEGTLLSVRGLGRARVLSVGGRTRKDRLRVEVGIYN